jgi:DNA polymerase-3 subunit gamma/tau
MLRTFDELGYRQEQRFHFELGLLKLVHLRRLLPIEEALSGVGGGGGASVATSAASARGVGQAGRAGAGAGAVSTAQAAGGSGPGAVSARPAFSPFEQDSARRRPEATASGPIAVSAVTTPHPVTETRGATAVSVAPASRPAMQSAPMPMPAPVRLPEAMPLAVPSRLEERVEEQADVALPAAVFETTAPLADGVAGEAEGQASVVEALMAAGHASAADAMADAAWTVVNGEARVQTDHSAAMLAVVMNADAERIARAALREAGVEKMTLLPGFAKEGGAAAKRPRSARTGSVEARAMEHPVVQQAQRLFNAEVRSVIDLRETK